MNLKPALKYSNGTFFKDAIIFYSIFIFSFLLFGIANNAFGGEIHGGGFEVIYAIFISCYHSLKNNIPMFLQNSLSRKTLYISSFIQLIGFSIFTSIFNYLIIDDKLSKFAFNEYINIFDSAYYSDQTITSNIFLNIGFLFASILFAGSIGYFLSILLYRLSKTLKIILLSCSI